MDIKEHKLRENYTKIGQDYSWKIDMTKYRSLQKIQNTIKSLEKLYKQVLQRIRPNILNFF
jgi:predicted patatin/cPLA2 family phospholipase